MTYEVGDETRSREAVDLRRLVDLLHAALVHHRDAMGERQRLGLIVRHVDERDADFLLQVDELDLHFLAELRVQRGQRLVEQQHCRMRDQRAAQRHALPLSAGQLVRIALGEALQAHVFQRRRDFGADFGRRRLRHLQRECDVALDGHMREKRVALEHHPHRPPLRRPAGEVLAVQHDAAGIGNVEARDHPQQRGLAATRGPEKGEELAGVDADADVVDRGEVAETAGDVLDVEQRHRAGL